MPSSEVSQRTPVSVVVPFRGSATAALHTRAALSRLELSTGDELIVADNSDGLVAGPIFAPAVAVVDASGERSSYHARNVGARRAGNDWLLFLDADCVPAPSLLDAYFARPIDADVGAIAGTIAIGDGSDALIGRYLRSRGFFDQSQGLHTHGGGAATANLLVRRAAFESLGGFAEGIRSGGDVDLSWRLQGGGWRLERRPEAAVEHRHREGMGALMRAVARYGAGSRWLNERYPGASPRWPLPRALGGAAADCVGLAIRGRGEEASFRAIDGLGLIAHNIGYRASNSVPQRRQ